ncbi:TRADD-N-associated membrane domain-containing protein [Dactylosporangium sp. CA-052675]|uniref:TRADD-N-associated membrane domain-containing protein n=1 Tax=Dactylosporangium sp. CA-052675 TaxID=3239927 RepID=UPI003D8FFA56
MGPELILAAIAALGSSGVAAAIAGAVSRFIGKKAGTVESDLIQTLGLSERKGNASDGEPTAPSVQAESQERNERDSIGDIFVNFGSDGDGESAEALADVVRRHSDGHTRLIVKYYAQGYQQALVTFIASLAFAIAGFGVVMWACAYLFQHPNEPEPAGVLGATGLVTQAIGYLFFRRADKARELMINLIDKLREDRDREIRFIAGLASAAAIKTKSLRDAVKVATATSLLGVSLPIAELEILAARASGDGDDSAPRVYIDAGPRTNGHSGDTNANAASEPRLSP